MTEAEKTWDVIIVGGGPAGLSAALWCSELGLETVLLEREAEFGGQLRWTYNSIGNYLGRLAANGSELSDVFVEQSSGFAYERIVDADVTSFELDQKRVGLADGRRFRGRAALILATGLRRRCLGVPGEQRLFGRGVLRSGVADKAKVAGRSAMIVGGGDSALENALLLSQSAAKVYLVHRRNEFTARAEFLSAARLEDKIEFITDASVSSIHGDAAVEATTVQDSATGTERVLSVEAVLVRIGYQPNTELFRDQILLDSADYVRVDGCGRSSADGVFAVGDVANPSAPTISAAVGTGAMAAKAIADGISKI